MSKRTKCPMCGGPATMIDKAPPGESGDVVKCAKACEDGTETETTITVKATHYIPSETRGRMHMRMSGVGGDWKHDGAKGSIYMPLGGADVVVTIDRGPDKMDEHVTLDARSLIAAALRVVRAGGSRGR